MLFTNVLLSIGATVKLLLPHAARCLFKGHNTEVCTKHVCALSPFPTILSKRRSLEPLPAMWCALPEPSTSTDTHGNLTAVQTPLCTAFF